MQLCGAVRLPQARMVHRCVCVSDACREEGTEAGIKLPEDAFLRRRWLEALGIDPDDHYKLDARVSIVHFLASDLEAKKVNPGTHKPAVVTVRAGAIPQQTDEQIRLMARGAIGGRLKAEARCATLHGQLLQVTQEAEQLRANEFRLRDELRTQAAVRSANTSAGIREVREPGRMNCMDHTILYGMDPDGAVGLCGLHNHECLEVSGRRSNF